MALVMTKLNLVSSVVIRCFNPQLTSNSIRLLFLFVPSG